ncbi:MAG: hypothetical protein MUC50_14350 [Myxococcota bacterium]|nr:hypothetical protein [Myxococcota bacterium]
MRFDAWTALFAAAALVWSAGCDPENTKRYPCVEKDCQATCQAKGRPPGDDDDHPFGQCIDDVCQCLEPDTAPWDWSDPQEPQTDDSDDATATDTPATTDEP